MKVVLAIVFMVSSIYAITQEELAKRSFEKISGYKSSISKTTMILKNANGQENIRKMEFSKLEDKNGDKSLVNFLYPNDIKDTKLLSFEKIGKDDKQWLYLPALKRVKRISSRNKSGSFMASEFSYEDISSQNYKNYNYSGKADLVNMDGKKYFKIIRFPKDKNSGYKRQIVYIDSKTFLASYGEYFDRQDRLLKKIYFKKYQKIAGVYRVVEIHMQNVQNDKSSTLIWDEDKIDQKLKSKDFTKRVLK